MNIKLLTQKNIFLLKYLPHVDGMKGPSYARPNHRAYPVISFFSFHLMPIGVDHGILTCTSDNL